VSERRLCAALVFLAAGVVSPGVLAKAETEQKLSPKQLYQALTKVPRERTALPNGYQSTSLGAVPSSKTARRHHVVGAVAIGVTKKGTAGARILYIVFPTRADALANWKEATRGLPKKRPVPPSFLPKPAAMFNATATLGRPPAKTTPLGTTTLVFVTGNLVVQVDTSSLTNVKHGDVLGAIALAQFAGTHLASVAGPAAPAKPAEPGIPAPPVI
jgi:hypothetical protein